MSELQHESAKHFHIFGHGISFSKSPLIHATGFRHYGLPHTYDIREPVLVDEVAPLIADDFFGGASVTMPHKLAVHKFCEQQTVHAKRIGAINTLIVRHDEHGQRYLLGENTDWSGLYSIITQGAKSSQKQTQTGLVLGAGGASRAALYALFQAGVTDIALVNRTRANAEKLASHFSSIFHVKVFSTVQDLDTQPDIIIGTIPADRTQRSDFEVLFKDASKPGLCIDMAYKPRRTPLLATAEESGWETVPGVEVLLHQAFAQFELWTGLEAPRTKMLEALYASDRVDEESVHGRL